MADSTIYVGTNTSQQHASNINKDDSSVGSSDTATELELMAHRSSILPNLQTADSTIYVGNINKDDSSHSLECDTAAELELMGRRSTVLPNLQMTLSWENVSVSVHIPGSKKRCFGKREPDFDKQVLTNVSGIVQPGTILAIMGASGGGKSTLMNVLTCRNVAGLVVKGDILINGCDLGEHIKHVSAYVQQDAMFFANLTVREQLQFRALLKMDIRLTRQNRLDRVEEVIQEMGLTKCADTRIGEVGGFKKGISGGERARLSFASEALTNPPIFFLDEPTSGLDTFMAQNMVNVLKGMAKRGRSVLCTIHQPSSDVFSMFTDILLLAEGKTAFMGPSEDALEFFQRHGYPCPVNFNPADHFILTLAIKPGHEKTCRDKVTILCDAFSTDEASVYIQGEINLHRHISVTSSLTKEGSLKEKVSAIETRNQSSWGTQMKYLFWRSWVNTFRDVMLFKVRVLQALAISLILGTIFFQVELSQKGVQDINGALFLLITTTTITQMMAVLNSFPTEVGIFMREYGSGLYTVNTYYLSKSLAEVPLFVAISIGFTSICYWMIGLYNDIPTYLIAVGVLVLVTNVVVSLGFVISALSDTVQIAVSFAPAIIVPFMILGGLFINDENIPVYLQWLSAMSWFKYAYELLMLNQWENIYSIPCAQGVANSTIGMFQCPFHNGQDVLRHLSMNKDDYWLDIAGLVVLIFAFRIVAYLILLYKARKNKS